MVEPEEIKTLLEGFPVIEARPVQWGEQDSFGHVNHAVYFRWYETSRIAYAQRVGLMGLHKAEGIGSILASVTCDYRRQLTFPDLVYIGARVVRIGRTSLTMEHKLVSREQGVLAAEGRATLVVFDYKANASRPVPDSVRRAIEELEGRSFSDG